MLHVRITSDAAREIAGRSRGTPRIANGLLRRMRDFAQVLGNGVIDRAIVEHGLKALNVDESGLDDMDNKILLTLIDKFKGGPAGIDNIATAVSEEAGTLEEVYEPFLIPGGLSCAPPRPGGHREGLQTPGARKKKVQAHHSSKRHTNE